MLEEGKEQVGDEPHAVGRRAAFQGLTKSANRHAWGDVATQQPSKATH